MKIDEGFSELDAPYSTKFWNDQSFDNLTFLLPPGTKPSDFILIFFSSLTSKKDE